MGFGLYWIVLDVVNGSPKGNRTKLVTNYI